MTLREMWAVEKITDSGCLFAKKKCGFLFKSSGVDISFSGVEQLEQLHRKWRATLRLAPNEELQFIYRHRTDFDDWVEKQLQQSFMAENAYGRRILLDRLAASMEMMGSEVPTLISSQIAVCYWTFEAMSEKRLLERRLAVQSKLSQFGPKFRSLNRIEILKEIYLSASDSRASSKHEFEWPAIQIDTGRLCIENDYFRAAELKQLPESSTRFGMIEALTKLPYPLDVSLRIKGRDSRPIVAKLERKRNLLQARRGQKNSPSPTIDSQIEQIDEVLRSLADSSDQIFDLSLTVGLRLPRELKAFQQRALAKIIWSASQMDFCELEETDIGTFDAYLECIPTFHGENIRTHTVLSSNAIHFLPLFRVSRGDEKPIITFRNSQSDFYGINPVDPRLANYNWLVSGTSGAGKSFFVNSLISQSQPLKPNVYIVDVGGSYNKLIRFLGGQVHSLEPGQGFEVSPFFLKFSEDSLEENLRRQHIFQVFLEMVRIDGHLPSIEIRQKLSEVLDRIFALGELPARPISFLNTLLEQDASAEAQRLRLLLRPWCGDGYLARYLDTNKGISVDERLLAFDLKGLSDFDDLSRVVQLIICAHLWARIRRTGGRQFTWIVLDEVAFSLLKFQSEFVDELISTLRKYYAGAIIVVQDLEKITSNFAGSSILQNTQSKAILQQRGDPRNFAEALSLSAEDLWAIENLQRVKGSYSDIFLIRDQDRVILRHEPSLLEYWLSTTAPEDVVMLSQFLKDHPGEYQKNFLEFVKAQKEAR